MKMIKCFDFNKKTILITGATGKIGTLMAKTFHNLNADLILISLIEITLCIIFTLFKYNINRPINKHIKSISLRH